jgi:hypothetical protein
LKRRNRRDFITLLGGAAAWSVAARAQQAERMRRIGVLLPAAAGDPSTGYSEGESLGRIFSAIHIKPGVLM